MPCWATAEILISRANLRGDGEENVGFPGHNLALHGCEPCDLPLVSSQIDSRLTEKRTLMKSTDLHQKSLATRVFEIVRNAIVVGEFAPGSLHSVQEIAAKLNVSRTPVREAMLKLEELGMISFERNRGAPHPGDDRA